MRDTRPVVMSAEDYELLMAVLRAAQAYRHCDWEKDDGSMAIEVLDAAVNAYEKHMATTRG